MEAISRRFGIDNCVSINFTAIDKVIDSFDSFCRKGFPLDVAKLNIIRQATGLANREP